jgi:hypothetical protein
VEGTSGTIGAASFSSTGRRTLINEGRITADGESGLIIIKPDVFINRGTLEERNGARLVVETSP